MDDPGFVLIAVKGALEILQGCCFAVTATAQLARGPGAWGKHA
jgi:hypothetical protein